MQTISSNLAKQTFGRVLEAAQRGPVLIEKHHHPTAVILSVTEYDRLKLGGSQNSIPQQTARVIKSSVAKSLPIIPTKAAARKSTLTAQEMIELVHEAETELDA
ncbi:MAG: type II toxin-antitoxin system Phd/YefM family antitoxin [Puniceicoccaceae bacterium]